MNQQHNDDREKKNMLDDDLQAESSQTTQSKLEREQTETE